MSRPPRLLNPAPGERRKCLGCERMVRGWTYCKRCRARVRAGEALPNSGYLERTDVGWFRNWATEH